MTDSNLVSQFLTQINNVIDYKLSGLSQIKSAVVQSVNVDGTVNLYIPPSKIIYHNVQNQSIYRNLKQGDNIKIIVENGSLSNMWVIGGFQLSTGNEESRAENKIDFDMIYPVGSIYMSMNSVDPQFLFGGRWERLTNRFLLGASDSYAAWATGGSATHTLTVDELPSHSHHMNGIEVEKSADNGWVAARSTKFTQQTDNDNTYTDPSGGGVAHNNMPPYLTVYMWTRVG